jgi:hypothetical protein
MENLSPTGQGSMRATGKGIAEVVVCLSLTLVISDVASIERTAEGMSIRSLQKAVSSGAVTPTSGARAMLVADGDNAWGNGGSNAK